MKAANSVYFRGLSAAKNQLRARDVVVVAQSLRAAGVSRIYTKFFCFAYREVLDHFAWRPEELRLER